MGLGKVKFLKYTLVIIVSTLLVCTLSIAKPQAAGNNTKTEAVETKKSSQKSKNNASMIGLILILICGPAAGFIGGNRNLLAEQLAEMNREREEDILNCRNEINPIKTIHLDEEYFKPTGLEKLMKKDPNFCEKDFVANVKETLMRISSDGYNGNDIVDLEIISPLLSRIPTDLLNVEVQIVKILNYINIDATDQILVAIKMKFTTNQVENKHYYENFKLKFMRHENAVLDKNAGFNWTLKEIYWD